MASLDNVRLFVIDALKKYHQNFIAANDVALADALSNYVSKEYANTTYLTKADAATTYITYQYANNTYVAKEAGKGLSTEDFTTAYMTKLSDIEDHAQVNIIEEVQVDPNDIISLDDESPVENSTSNIEVPTPIVNNEQGVSESNANQIEISQPISPEEIEVDSNIINSELETVSIDTTSLKLEDDKIETMSISTPELPAPTIGEINPDLLGNNYDEAERINNEKIAIKEQQELAELERKRQEAELAAQNAAPRPDLLAELNNMQVNVNSIPKKKRKIGKIILILFILAIISFGLYYFLVLSK